MSAELDNGLGCNATTRRVQNGRMTTNRMVWVMGGCRSLEVVTGDQTRKIVRFAGGIYGERLRRLSWLVTV